VSALNNYNTAHAQRTAQLSFYVLFCAAVCYTHISIFHFIQISRRLCWLSSHSHLFSALITEKHFAPAPASVMYGIGVDLAHAPRLWRAVTRFGDRFLRRAFHPSEIARFRELGAATASSASASPSAFPSASSTADAASATPSDVYFTDKEQPRTAAQQQMHFLASRYVCAKAHCHPPLCHRSFRSPLFLFSVGR
jgi:hypothetical protein